MKTTDGTARIGLWLGMVATGCVAIFLGIAMLVLLWAASRLAYSEVQVFKLESSEQAWPSAPALVISDALSSATSTAGNVKWFSYWTYSYTVDGRPYLGKSTDIPAGYDTKWFSNKADAINDGLTRPPGSQTTAYYDPAAPERSVLDKRRMHGGDHLLIRSAVGMLAGALMLGFIMMIILKSARAQWRALARRSAVDAY